MFKSEREMQEIFVSLLKKRKTCGLIYEEVGNRNFFFRTDIVEYKARDNIISYELKLKDFKKLIEQSLYTLSIYDKSYVVVPYTKKEQLLKVLAEYPYEAKDKLGIILVNREKYQVIKSPSNESTRNYSDKWNVTLVSDLIIRGYYKSGNNACKSYK